MKNRYEVFKKNRFLLLSILSLIVVVAFLLRISYAAMILCYIGIYAIATSALDITWGYTGQISYGHAGFYAIGAYTTAMLSTRLGLPTLVTIFLGAILSAIFGILISFSAAKLVKHFLALLTMSFGQVIYMFVNSATNITGGSAGIKHIPRVELFGWVARTNGEMFIVILIFLLLTLYTKQSIVHSRIGRAFVSIRENSIAANGLGVNVKIYKVLSFAISSFFTGLAGALYAHMIGYISPDSFQSSQSVIFMTVLLFGGLGTFFGPLIGSVVVVLVKEFFQVFSEYQQLVYAFFIIVVLFKMPEGLVGTFPIVKSNIKRILIRNKHEAEGKEQC